MVKNGLRIRTCDFWKYAYEILAVEWKESSDELNGLNFGPLMNEIWSRNEAGIVRKWKTLIWFFVSKVWSLKMHNVSNIAT